LPGRKVAALLSASLFAGLGAVAGSFEKDLKTVASSL